MINGLPPTIQLTNPISVTTLAFDSQQRQGLAKV